MNVLFCDLDFGCIDCEVVRSLLDNIYFIYRKRKWLVLFGFESGFFNKNWKSFEISLLNLLDILYFMYIIFDYVIWMDLFILGGLKLSVLLFIFFSLCIVIGFFGNMYIYLFVVDLELLFGIFFILLLDFILDSDGDLNMMSSDEIDMDDEENDDRWWIDVFKMVFFMFFIVYDEVLIFFGDLVFVFEDCNSWINIRKILFGLIIDLKKFFCVYMYCFFILEWLWMFNDILNFEDLFRVFFCLVLVFVIIVNGYLKRNLCKELVFDLMLVDENGYVGYLNVD